MYQDVHIAIFLIICENSTNFNNFWHITFWKLHSGKIPTCPPHLQNWCLTIFQSGKNVISPILNSYSTVYANNQKLLRGSQNLEIRSRDPGHAHLWVVLWSLRTEAPFSMSVPNLKQIALSVQKLLGSPKFRPAADPFPGAWDGQNLISWRWSLPKSTFTYKPSLVRIDARNFELTW